MQKKETNSERRREKKHAAKLASDYIRNEKDKTQERKRSAREDNR